MRSSPAGRGFRSDPVSKLAGDRLQHQPLLANLRDEGWTVHANQTSVLLIGAPWQIYVPFSQVLSDIPGYGSAQKNIINMLCVQAILGAHSIVMARRVLEKSAEQSTDAVRGSTLRVSAASSHTRAFVKFQERKVSSYRGCSLQCRLRFACKFAVQGGRRPVAVYSFIFCQKFWDRIISRYGNSDDI